MKNNLEMLNTLLSTIMVAASNAQGRHWTTTGENFRSNHLLFGDVYDTLSESADTVAEAIRVLGGVPNNTMLQFLNASGIIQDPYIAGKMARTQIAETRDDLSAIVMYIDGMCESGEVDAIVENDITAIGSKLRHWLLFLQGQLA